MKLSWLAKELFAVLFILLVSIVISGWAIAETSGSALRYRYIVLAMGFLTGFIPITIEFIVSVKNGTLFIRDRKVIAERKQKNRRLARLLIAPAIVLGMLFAYFPGSIKIFLLSGASGYLLPYSVGIVVHFIKNHKEIEKITKK